MAQPISERFEVTGNDMASSIRNAATTLGVSARDLATVISYETGGSFSTKKWGGKGGDYLGLIQFGPEERRKYGAYWGQAFEDQMQAAVRYFKDRGLQPGSGLRDLYSTVLTGSPGNYNRSDGYGTVDQHIAGMSGHQANADRILGKQIVSDGVVDANRKISASAASQSGVQAASGPGVAGMTRMQGALGVLGAGFGAFSMGMQSGDPFSGAIGGAMAGLGAVESLGALGLGAMATPVGLIGGAIVGQVGRIPLGNRKETK